MIKVIFQGDYETDMGVRITITHKSNEGYHAKDFLVNLDKPLRDLLFDNSGECISHLNVGKIMKGRRGNEKW